MSSLAALRLPRRKGRSVLQVVGSVCFVVIGVVMLVTGLTSQPLDVEPLKIAVVGAMATLLFGLLGFLGARALARPAPVVDDRGIWDSTWGLSVGFIPWEQAVGFQQTTVACTRNKTQDLVAVYWADEQWAWAHTGLLSRCLNRMNRGQDVPLGSLSADVLKVTGSRLALMSWSSGAVPGCPRPLVRPRRRR